MTTDDSSSRSPWVSAQVGIEILPVTSRELRIIAKAGGVRYQDLPGLNRRYHREDLKRLAREMAGSESPTHAGVLATA